MVVVDGIGIVSALGIGAKENTVALEAERDGLRPITNFSTIHNVPAGELPLSNNDLKKYLSINEKKVVSRTSLLGMIAAEEALNNAHISNRQNIALISATTVGGMDLTPIFYKKFMNNRASGSLRFVRQHDCSNSTNAIREYCHIGGFSTAISTACSSAANAIMMGCRLIEQNLVDYVIAGGTDALCAYTINGFKSLMILDSAKCRPFDASRAGLNLGEAAAYIVLTRPELASNPYCCVSGYANANDAFHQTAMTSDGRGAQMAMRGAIEKAKIDINDIDYINVHGTGTPNNDASEMAAMKTIWGNNVPSFSSTKAFTGHTLAAAGSVEAVFSILAIAKNKIWANLNFTNPIDDNAPKPITHTTLCNVHNVLSNSFGFGGNCTSLLFSKI